MNKENSQLIENFYNSFSNQDVRGMLEQYHEKVRFQDPVFGKLNTEQVKAMWEMLVERSKGELKIRWTDIVADDDKGTVQWVAEYFFGKQKRKVVNRIKGSFLFSEGKIIQHHDSFDLWRWSSQALGIPGLLLGWTPVLKNNIRKRSKTLLENYLKEKGSN
ncbi:MAG: nuclear transport factor 2 family protein [Flavobacteriales bacterium]|nr:nuclear transport factor 2 family protein [Flavobacteriales bacterium]